MCVCVVLQEVLDADDTPLRSRRGELMKRDIVQFVPFRELSSKSGANFSLVSPNLKNMHVRRGNASKSSHCIYVMFVHVNCPVWAKSRVVTK